MRSLYVTHAEVVMDPDVPVPEWGLSVEGRRRVEAFAARGVLPQGARLVASTERKAVETAGILAAALGSEVETYSDLGENDRSATGYLAGRAFEAQVAAFFARPEESAAGWETAAAAQARMVAAVGRILAKPGDVPLVVFVGHGGVGTLLKCHCARRPIARAEDQRVRASPGGGNCFVCDLAQTELASDWQPMESFAGVPRLL
jgi:broad specificity phosphatase PhoE